MKKVVKRRKSESSKKGLKHSYLNNRNKSKKKHKNACEKLKKILKTKQSYFYITIELRFLQKIYYLERIFGREILDKRHGFVSAYLTPPISIFNVIN